MVPRLEKHTQPRNLEVIEGRPEKVIRALHASRTGVARFAPRNLRFVEAALVKAGYEPVRDKAGVRFRQEVNTTAGAIHNHRFGSLIVHETSQGTGTADFYWPVSKEDIGTRKESFDPAQDAVLAQTLNVPINSETVLVFASETWHLFRTPANTLRESWACFFDPV